MIRISVTGPESTGKSWLARQLADHYQTVWVPEYARTYLEDIERPYTYNDILRISQKQFEEENSAPESTGLLFCDTDFCVASIWCNVKYGKCHEWITKQLERNHYGLYLLCDIDLPWQYDPLREHPEMRSELFGMYRDLLLEKRFNFKVVKGTGDERLRNAIVFVDEYLKSIK
ncbi:MAG: ATP-binding protein [Bacteroidales bacterium]|nr:ATP-binding protein [Bacteroidales bacterium]